MSDILVRDVPGDVLDALKERAGRNRRSLQQEVLAILEWEARHDANRLTAIEAARVIRERLAATGRDFGNSVDDIREDRAR